ncbi:TrmH family RNA methyltransferase [Candidatus Stoquefichus massiliensis]|uniref:TrmH family RNA methyltransferase n=1 Tax=Candidatus Stoquefichus massiliensis TaxID=1470350 RepID=UPI00048A0914|nr:TrmH family RNA methyltransferase [Candidatus Stoquefichus massiliensis]
MKLYKKGDDTSYTLGVFPTIELLKTKPENVMRVVVHSSIEKNKGYPLIQQLCQQHHIPMNIHDKTIDKLSPKSNCFAIGVFQTYSSSLNDENHIVLVNPMDMGNMGTMMRTMLGFGYTNLVIVRPAVDIFDPKVVRASMGSIFHLNVIYYDDFQTYYHQYHDREFYPFMLKGAKNIHQVTALKKHSLIFGNESSGLDDCYLEYGQSVFIPHSDKIDSLNLSMALGLALFHFSKENFKQKEVLRENV